MQYAHGLSYYICYMKVFDNERIRDDLDLRDSVNVKLEYIKKELDAQRVMLNNHDRLINNIKIDVERAIKKCLTTLNIADELP